MFRTFRTLRLFSQLARNPNTQPPIPAAPKLFPGELEQFRYEREKQVLYEGYTEEQLFGARYGVKHSKEMKTEMMKDTIAALLLFVGGFTLIVYNHNTFRKNLVLYQRYVENDLTKVDTIPDHARTYPGVRRGVNPEIISQTQY